MDRWTDTSQINILSQRSTERASTSSLCDLGFKPAPFFLHESLALASGTKINQFVHIRKSLFCIRAYEPKLYVRKGKRAEQLGSQGMQPHLPRWTPKKKKGFFFGKSSAAERENFLNPNVRPRAPIISLFPPLLEKLFFFLSSLEPA